MKRRRRGMVLAAGMIIGTVGGVAAIATASIPSTEGIINGCYFLKDANYCDRITLEPHPVTGIVGDLMSDSDANVDMAAVNSGSANVNDFKVTGVDMEVAYTFELAQLVESWSGDLTIRSLTTYMDELLLTGEHVTAPPGGYRDLCKAEDATGEVVTHVAFDTTGPSGRADKS